MNENLINYYKTNHFDQKNSYFRISFAVLKGKVFFTWGEKRINHFFYIRQILDEFNLDYIQILYYAF